MRKNLLIAGGAFALPLILWARSAGPPPGRSGVPGEADCTACHRGEPLNPEGGSFTISGSGGDVYVPGVKQVITLQISDTVGAGRVYGFQATVRTKADAKVNAGTLTASMANTSVLCSSTDLTSSALRPAGGNCPSEQPLEFVQHNSRLTPTTLTFEWTPPATAQGEVVMYVAVNSTNGNFNNQGDRIFTRTKSFNVPARPAIDSGGVISLSAYGGGTAVAPGGWVEIYGQSLSNSTREWGPQDFAGNVAPTTIDGVSVSIGGRPAAVRYVSPRQLNIQVPDLMAGPHTMTITNPTGPGDNYTVQVAGRVPGLQAPPQFKIGDRQYVTVIHPDTTTTSTIFYGGLNVPGATMRGLAPGRQFTIYAVGMGAGDPAVLPGQITPATPLSNLPNVILRAGNTQLQTMFGGLVPSMVGLYSFNVVAPDIADGDHAFTGSIGGVAIPANLFINIKR